MRKKILVTGSNGLLGQKLTELYLKQPGKELFASGKGEDRLKADGEYTYLEMDISDEEAVRNIFDRVKPDVVIHTAAMTNVDACELDCDACDKLNVDAVRYIATHSERYGARMIHISTDFIFDGTHGPLTEEEIPNPLSYYGLSKLKGEEIVMDICKSWSILRTVLVYGVVKDMSRSNIVLWAMQALKNKQSITVVDDQFRTPTLAEDLAMGAFLAEDRNAQGIFNISGKDFMSIYELVQRVAAYSGLGMENVKKGDSLNLNQPAKRPPVTGFVLEKAMKELGYNPHSFEEGIAIVEEQLKQAAK